MILQYLHPSLQSTFMLTQQFSLCQQLGVSILWPSRRGLTVRGRDRLVSDGFKTFIFLLEVPEENEISGT